MLSVTHFYREPRKTGQSIEGIFKSVKSSLTGKVNITDVYCDAALSRYQNILRAGKLTGDLNHITGDVNFIAMGMRGKKVILTIHDFGFYENPVHSKIVKTVYGLFWFRLPFKFVNRVTVVSEFTKQKLLKYFHFPEKNIYVIPDPVKPVFRLAEKTPPVTPFTILMLGSGKHKNLDNLIDAVHGTEHKLEIVGWPSPDELEKLTRYNIKFKLYHHLTDEEVFERYVACDILYIASHYEGFGMPIIEAQTVGRPVITSNIGAMKEVGEGSCILVDPKNVIETRQAIEALTDSSFYTSMVEKGKTNASKYSCDYVASLYNAVYEELAAAKK